MAKVGANDSPCRLAWSEGWRPHGTESAFIKWTAWTLAVSFVLLLLLLLLLYAYTLTTLSTDNQYNDQ